MENAPLECDHAPKLDIYPQEMQVIREQREALSGHRGLVVWFTGLSGSGKSTIANATERELHRLGRRTYVLDGDNVRLGLNRDLDFSDFGRSENIRRVAEVSRLMLDSGMIVLTAFISPFRKQRQFACDLIGASDFLEVFVDTDLETCELRDPKGLYKKARSGLIADMTGIGSPYETPASPNLVLRGSSVSLMDTVKNLVGVVEARTKLSRAKTSVR